MTDCIFADTWSDFVVLNSFSQDLFENFQLLASRNLPFGILEQHFDELSIRVTPLEFVTSLFRLRVVVNEKRVFYCFFTCLSHKLTHIQIKYLVSIIPAYGYWKDLLELYIHSATHNVSVELLSCIVDEYVQQLQKDQKTLGNPKDVSYAGKWAPREGSKYDKAYKLASKLANEIFPDEKHSDALKKYRKLIVQLTDEKNVVETKMSANKWDELKNCSFSKQNAAKYRNAIERHDLNASYLHDSKMKFDALVRTYPIDCVFRN